MALVLLIQSKFAVAAGHVKFNNLSQLVYDAGRSAAPVAIESPRKDIKIEKYSLPLYLDKVSSVSSRVMTSFDCLIEKVINRMHYAGI